MLTRIREILNVPRNEAILLILLIIGSYLYFARPLENAQDIAVSGGLAYLATGQDGIRLVDVNHSEQGIEIGHFDPNINVKRLAIAGDRLYAAAGRSGVRLIDLTAPGAFFVTGAFDTPGSAEDVAVDGNLVYVADGNQGLRIYEQRDEEKFTEVGALRLPGRTNRVAVDGNRAYVADHRRFFRILDVSDRRQPKEIGSFRVNTAVQEIVMDGNLAYLAAGPRGLMVLDLSDLAKIEIIGGFDTSGEAKGFAISGFYGYLADHRGGLRILDLTDPTSIQQIGVQAGIGTVTDVELEGDRAMVSTGYEGLRVFQTEVLISPNKVGQTASQAKAEDIVKVGNLAFIAAGERGLRVLNVADPQAPREIQFFDTEGYATGVSVKGDLAYVSDRNGGLLALEVSNQAQLISKASGIPLQADVNDVAFTENFVLVADGRAGLHILDFTNPFTPTVISSYDSPGNALGVTSLGSTVYLADGMNGLRIVDISDIGRPTEIGAYDTPGDALAVEILMIQERLAGAALNDPNALVTRLYACVADSGRGLRVIDVTNPRAPAEVGFFEISGSIQDVTLEGTMAYLAGGTAGLVVVDLSTPSKPRQVGIYDTPGQAKGLDADDDFAYVADNEHGLRVVRISDPAQPVEIGAYDAPGWVADVATSGDTAYIVDGSQGMWVWDLQNEESPTERSFYPVPGEASRVFLANGNAYIAAGSTGINVASVSDPASPVRLGVVDTPGRALGITVVGNYAYVADGEKGLQVVDVTNPEAMRIVGAYDTAGTAWQAVRSDDYAFVADGIGGLQVIKVADPKAPELVNAYSQLKDVRGLVVVWPYAYLAAGRDSLRILDISRPLSIKEVAALNLGELNDIVIVGPYAFVAGSTQTVQIVDMLDPLHPRPVGQLSEPFQALTLDVLQQNRENRPSFFRMYIASGPNGLQLYRAEKDAAIRSLVTYETPGTAWPTQIFQSYMARLTGESSQIPTKVSTTVGQFLWAFMLFGFLFTLLWLALITNYVLPVKNGSERVSTFARLVFFMFGMHGVAAHVREGKIIQNPEEGRRSGPGVVLVDLSSAVIIQRRGPMMTLLPRSLKRKPKDANGNGAAGAQEAGKPAGDAKKASRPASMRVEGPGLIFTGFQGFPYTFSMDEKLKTSVDLRPQVRLTPDVVKSSTRDGIEFQNKVTTVFTLGQDPDILLVGYAEKFEEPHLRAITIGNGKETVQNDVEFPRYIQEIKKLADELDPEDRAEIHRYAKRFSQKLGGQPVEAAQPAYDAPKNTIAPFSYDRDRIFRAVYGRAQDVTEERFMDWTELPPYVATEIFRNLIATKLFDDIFRPDDPDPVQFPLRSIKDTFSRLVRNQGVLSFQFVERKDGEAFVEGQVWNQEDLIFHPVQELKNPKLLRTRGIKVIAAGFSELRPVKSEVRQRLLDTCRANWQKQAAQTLGKKEYEAIRARGEARKQAQLKLINELATICNDSDETQEALVIQIFQSLEKVMNDPLARQFLTPDTINLFRSMQGMVTPAAPPQLPSGQREIPPSS